MRSKYEVRSINKVKLDISKQDLIHLSPFEAQDKYFEQVKRQSDEAIINNNIPQTILALRKQGIDAYLDWKIEIVETTETMRDYTVRAVSLPVVAIRR